MKKKNLFAGVMVSLVAMLAFAGCTSAPAPTKAPDEVIKDGLTNLSKITSAKYDVAMNVDATDETGVNTKMDMKLKGAFDLKDKKDPKVIFGMDGSLSSEEMTGSAKFDLMVNKEALYFNVGKLDLGEMFPIPEDMNKYMGKWWSYALPEGAVDEMSESTEMDFDVEELDELFTKVTPEYVGTDSVAGDPSWHYKVVPDKEVLAEMAAESGAGADFENADVVGEVWVSAATSTFNQFKMSVDMKGGEGEPKGTLNLTLTLSDINKPVTVSAPAGVAEFNAEEFMAEPSVAPLLMMMMGGGATYDDSMMYDDSALYDSSTLEGTEMTEEELNELMGELDAMDLE